MSGQVAPHEGFEIDLVLAGVKPLAVIEHRKDKNQYFRALYLGDTAHVAWRDDPESGHEVIVSKSAFLIQDYMGLLASGVKRLGRKGYHRAMGCLFGYSPADVEAYINAEIDCDCSKCNGAMRQLRDDKQNRRAARTQPHYQ